MHLPNADQGIIDLEQLRGYCLNPAHTRGRHKGRVFAAALGITAREAAWLRMAFLRAARDRPAVAGRADAHGRRYHLDLEVIGPEGSAPVRTTWIIRTGETAPRLTSCFVL